MAMRKQRESQWGREVREASAGGGYVPIAGTERMLVRIVGAESREAWKGLPYGGGRAFARAVAGVSRWG
jgi:hypothetical protein